MGRQSYLWLLLVLVIASTRAQEQTAVDDVDADAVDDGGDGADGPDDDASGKAADEKCDEAWNYITFLDEKLIAKISELISSFKETTNIAETIEKTMQDVLEMRENLLTRIKDLRKEEECVSENQNLKQEEKLGELSQAVMQILIKLVEAAENPTTDALRDISISIFDLDNNAKAERMRIIMTPDNAVIPITDGDCDCEIYTTIKGKLEALKSCAEEEADGDSEDDSTDGADDDSSADTKAAETCVEPPMYNMELLTLTEDIDKSITSLYLALVTETDKDTKNGLLEKLTGLKDVREKIDEITKKLLKEEDNEKLKRVITRSIRSVISQVQSELAACVSKCGVTAAECDSCGAFVISTAVDKMEVYKQYLADQNRDEDEKRDFVRGDLIKLINEFSDDSRAILTKQANLAADEELDVCDTQKQNVYRTIKAPMWMLVNTTIFSRIDQVEVMVDTMIDQLKELIPQFCGSTTTTVTTKDGPNCEWQEYEFSKSSVLPEVDQIIQTSIFKAKKDSDKKDAIIGLVNLQGVFDDRIKKLFQEELVCPEEVTAIKKTYMPQVNKCMEEFLRPSVRFTQMSRQQRISCIKVLRGAIESRSTKLLQFELERSLDGISQQNEIN